MITFLLFICISFILAFLWAPLLINILYKCDIRRRSKIELDKKVENHAQKTGTPVMGGALVVVTVLVLNLVFNFSSQVGIVLLTLLLGAVLGAIDDFFNIFGHDKVSRAVRKGITPFVSFSDVTWGLYKIVLLPWQAFKEVFRAMGSYQGGFKAHEKFLLQTMLGLFVGFFVYFQLGLNSVWLPLLGRLSVGIFYPILVTFLLVSYANAFSITDGLDGLSGGTHIIAFLALGVLACYFGKLDLALFCATVVGSEMAFLYFNIFPARVEMSDIGTLPLGMVYALVGVLLGRELAIPVIGGVFTLEVFSSFVQVWSVKLRGKRVFKIAPIHHHFEALGWPETKVTMRFWLFAAVAAVFGTLFALL
ncbi:MAG: hypothetical protein U9M98_01470 [Patescibacteria group bacterium]|nr:hypothetical protein [Patescibacteria group bacterium]